MRVKTIHAALAALPLLLATRLAAADANSELLEAARNGQLEQLSTALDHGADVNTAGEQDITALMFAAAGAHAETVQRLLAAKRHHVTALAALLEATRSGDAELVSILIAAHADAAVIDHQGCTPLELAEAGEHAAVVQLLKN